MFFRESLFPIEADCSYREHFGIFEDKFCSLLEQRTVVLYCTDFCLWKIYIGQSQNRVMVNSCWLINLMFEVVDFLLICQPYVSLLWIINYFIWVFADVKQSGLEWSNGCYLLQISSYCCFQKARSSLAPSFSAVRLFLLGRLHSPRYTRFTRTSTRMYFRIRSTAASPPSDRVSPSSASSNSWTNF